MTAAAALIKLVPLTVSFGANACPQDPESSPTARTKQGGKGFLRTLRASKIQVLKQSDRPCINKATPVRAMQAVEGKR